MVDKLESFTLFYPQNRAFVIGKVALPERLMFVDKAYRAFQLPLILMFAGLTWPLFLGVSLILLIQIIGTRNFFAINLIQFIGFGLAGLGILHLIMAFLKPDLLEWIERMWSRHKASPILDHGGQITDGRVLTITENFDGEGDPCGFTIEFKISQDSTTSTYNIRVLSLPAHLSNLKNGSTLKLLTNCSKLMDRRQLFLL